MLLRIANHDARRGHLCSYVTMAAASPGTPYIRYNSLLTVNRHILPSDTADFSGSGQNYLVVGSR